MLKRRMRAVLLLLVLGGPFAATLGSGATDASCSMCSKVCCCPRAAAGSCRLERPCGRSTETQATGLRVIENQAIVAAGDEFIPDESARSLPLASPMIVLDLVRTPPDPPPRQYS